MKKEKRLVAIILGLAMLFALSACNQGNPSTEDSADADGGAAASTTGDTIKIGYYGPFTGANSTTGIATFEGISIAIDEWNKNGGVLGKEIELVYYDDAGVTESAIKAVTRLIDSDNVVGIIGSQMSANIVATGDMIEASQIPEVSCGTSATWLDQGYTYLFRTVPENTTGTVALADAIEAVGTTKLAVLCSKDEASQGSCQQTLDQIIAVVRDQTTKTESSMRTLPLCPYTYQYFLNLRQYQLYQQERCGNCYDTRYTDFLCVDQMGTLLQPDYITQKFQQILVKYGLRRIRFHDLRHSCATIMLYLGYTLKDIQTWLGHSNYNFTADTYIHSGAGVHEQMAERLSEELKSLLPQNSEPPNLAENLSMC